mgnify:CR=1 FL=1
MTGATKSVNFEFFGVMTCGEMALCSGLEPKPCEGLANGGA